jgi:hypothetical protein
MQQLGQAIWRMLVMLGCLMMHCSSCLRTMVCFWDAAQQMGTTAWQQRAEGRV